MKHGFREKLFGFSLLLTLVVGLLVAIFLEHQRRNSIEQRIETELMRHARSTREFMLQSKASSLEQIDHLADRLGEATSSRITVIGLDGWVTGDSKLSSDDVRKMDNHGKRPEVLDALRFGKGVYRRHSETLKTDMLYVAIPYGEPQPLGTVRASMPLSEVDKAITELRWNLFIAGLLGMIVAIMIAWLAAHLLTRTLRDLIAHTKTISKRTFGATVKANDDIQSLVGSFDYLSSKLQDQIDDLALERDRTNAILHCMSEALFALDHEKQILFVNRAAKELFNISTPPAGKLLPEVTDVPALAEIVASTKPGKTVSKEFQITTNSERNLVAKAACQLSGDGCVVVMHDITEIRQIEKTQREFVANASHELRSPVSVIRANTETLIDGALYDEEVAPRLLEGLERNSNRLVHIISDLLDLARLDAHEYKVNSEPLALQACIESAVDILKPLALKKRQTLKYTPLSGCQVLADAQSLEQILLNLLDNAIRYTPENGRIQIRDKLSSNWVEIQVEDNGPGVPEEHKPFLFQRFYRFDAGRSRKMGGTGLGLSIVKDLAEAMGGAVGVTAALPTGCVFWVRLPQP